MTFEIDNEEWCITDDNTAEWALKTIADEQADCMRILAIGEYEIEDVKARMERARKACENRTNFLKSKLLEYFQNVNHRKTKTGIEKYALLSGTLTLKPASKKPVVSDERQLVEWLTASGMTDYIKTEQIAAWGELKKTLDFSGDVPTVKKTGEVVEGVMFVEIPEEFKIEIARKGDKE